MILRYIALRAEYGLYDDAFFHVFMDNVRFISNYLSRRIRSYHVETDGTFNMLSVSITPLTDSCQLESENVLAVKVYLNKDSMDKYMEMKDEIKRFEFYLSILEKGYIIASRNKNIPLEILLNLHQEFRLGGYRNEKLFKTKLIKEYGIKLKLLHVLSSYDYRLIMYVYNLKNVLIGEGTIYQTLPDEILFDKNVRNLEMDNNNLIVTDFLNHPQFVCSLEDLRKGIVKSECVDEHTREYIPNEKNAADFERLKW